jgi:hypothetical protein
MADVILKVDADVARYLAKLHQMADETEKAGKRAARGFGSAMEEAVTKSLLKVELLKKAFRTAAQIADDISRKAITSAERTGERALSLATSLAAMGVKDIGGTSQRIQGMSGNTTIAERVAFAESVSSASASGRVPFDSAQSMAAIEAYAQGGDLLYGKGGSALTKGLERRLPVDYIRQQQMAARPGLDNLGGVVGNELMIRNTQRMYEQEADANRYGRGMRQRLGAAETDFRASEGYGSEIAASVMESNGGAFFVNEANAQKSGVIIGEEVRKAIQANRPLNTTGRD